MLTVRRRLVPLVLVAVAASTLTIRQPAAPAYAVGTLDQAQDIAGVGGSTNTRGNN